MLILASWIDDDIPPEELDTSRLERRILVDFNRAIDDAEANAKLWYTLNQAFGRASDFQAEAYRLDDSVWGRAGQLLALGYLDLLTGYYPHEFGHAREGRSLGGYEGGLDLSDWSMGWPAYSGRTHRDVGALERIRGSVAGLNQEEYDAYLLHTNTLGKISFDEGFAFICRKLSDVTYDAYCDLDIDIEKEGDVWEYKQFLGETGVRLSDRAFLAQAALADLLSFKLWDSFRAVKNYLVGGRRTTTCTTFNVGGVEVTPPLVNFYMTPDGSFYNFVVFLNPKGRNPVELAVGTDVDFIGDGRLDRLRVGGKYGNLRARDGWPSVTISPFAYLDVDRSDLERRGHSVGVEVSYPLSPKSTLIMKYEHNSDDMVESVAKGKGNGSRLSLGLSSRF